MRPCLKNNGGQASAFNAGFAPRTGDIIFFLDSDDMMEPDSVETLLAIWRPETVLAHYPMTAVDSDGRPCGFFIPIHTLVSLMEMFATSFSLPAVLPRLSQAGWRLPDLLLLV